MCPDSCHLCTQVVPARRLTGACCWPSETRRGPHSYRCSYGVRPPPHARQQKRSPLGVSARAIESMCATPGQFTVAGSCGMKIDLQMAGQVLVAAILAVVLSGCRVFGPSAEQKATSAALLAASEACVYDVRDKQIKYEQSRNCNALGALSLQYMHAGGGRPGAPLETEIEFERARVMAWMALALSASNGQASRIW